jgi:hypothetical protein
MGDDSQSLGSRIFGFFTGKTATPAPAPGATPNDAQPADPTKHRNLLQKIFGTGKDKPKDEPPQ